MTFPAQPPPQVDADRWLSVDDIAAYLGVKRDTVYKWIDRRHMPAHKVGRLWKFQKPEVDQWVRSENAGEKQVEERGSNAMLVDKPAHREED